MLETAVVLKRKSVVVAEVEGEMENVVSVEKGGVAVEISVVEVETGVEAEVVAGGVEVETDDVGVTVEVVGTGGGLGKF